jgi:hypothetical protein
VSDVLPALRRDTRGQESVPIATVGMPEHPEAQQALHNVPSGRRLAGATWGVRNASRAATGRLRGMAAWGRSHAGRCEVLASEPARSHAGRCGAIRSKRSPRVWPELRCYFKSRSGGYAAAVDAEVVNNRCPRGRDFTCLKHGGQAGP